VSPYQFNVTDGNHTFGVQAADSTTPTFGTTTDFSWTVDLTGFMVDHTNYATIDAAYQAVQNDGTILVRSNAITSLANFNRGDNVTFTLQGGYDSNFNNPANPPSTFPALTISKGRVNVKNVVIR
jgi:hypothetical protein